MVAKKLTTIQILRRKLDDARHDYIVAREEVCQAFLSRTKLRNKIPPGGIKTKIRDKRHVNFTFVGYCADPVLGRHLLARLREAKKRYDRADDERERYLAPKRQQRSAIKLAQELIGTIAAAASPDYALRCNIRAADMVLEDLDTTSEVYAQLAMTVDLTLDRFPARPATAILADLDEVRDRRATITDQEYRSEHDRLWEELRWADCLE